MKNKFLLILSILIGLSTVNYCYAAQTTIIKKINLSGPDSVADRANRTSSFGSSNSGILQDPFVNSALNGYGNMLQGMNGNSFNAQEQAKQQLDYAKQQSNFSDD